MSLYRIREVDGSDDDIAETIQHINKTFDFPEISEVNLDTGYWWLGYLDREPIAFAGMVASCRWSNAGYLVRAGVLPGHRGHGMQRRLMRVRALKAKRLGWTHIVSDCTDNVPSANNFIRSGYLLYQPSQPWAFANSLYWKKTL